MLKLKTSIHVFSVGRGLWIFFFFLIPFSSEANRLRCYECLRLSCDSPTICDSVKLSMSRLFFPRRQNIEFNPNETCPETFSMSSNSSAWWQLSYECSKSDSICLQADIEVVTKFNGQKDSLQLEPSSEMKSQGTLRGCASRRFLMGLSEVTLEVKAEEAVNDTLPIITAHQTLPDNYTIREIFYHHFYIDHGTETALKCLENNCNARESARGRAHLFTPSVFLVFFGQLFACHWCSVCILVDLILNAMRVESRSRV